MFSFHVNKEPSSSNNMSSEIDTSDATVTPTPDKVVRRDGTGKIFALGLDSTDISSVNSISTIVRRSGTGSIFAQDVTATGEVIGGNISVPNVNNTIVKRGNAGEINVSVLNTNTASFATNLTSPAGTITSLGASTLTSTTATITNLTSTTSASINGTVAMDGTVTVNGTNNSNKFAVANNLAENAFIVNTLNNTTFCSTTTSGAVVLTANHSYNSGSISSNNNCKVQLKTLRSSRTKTLELIDEDNILMIEGLGAMQQGVASRKGQLCLGDSSTHKASIYAGTNFIVFGSPTVDHLQLGVTSGILHTKTLNSFVDNGYDLGSAGARYTNVYATSGVVNTSDASNKRDIEDCDLGLDFINTLRPRKYKRIDGERTHYGLVAQEVEEALLVVNKSSDDFAPYVKSDFEKEFEDGHKEQRTLRGLRYHEFIPFLIKAVQDLTEEINELKK